MSSPRPKLTVATTFPIHPARGGGQTRVVGLYGALAQLEVDVDVVCLVAHGERPSKHTMRPGLRELRVPKSLEHHDAEIALQSDVGGVPVTDIALALHHELTPGYAAAVRASARDASAVVACHPYVTEVLVKQAPGLPLIYEAQDVETDIKAGILGDHDVLEVVRECEALTCERASHVFTCADADIERLRELFGTPAERFAIVANGYDASSIPFTGPRERCERRRSLGLERFTVLFMGSWHGPNLEAARAVIAAAEVMPDTHVIIVGSAGSALAHQPTPDNVDLTGPVHDAFLHAVLSLADVAVNPMVSGSGTNLKMLEYAGAGIPLISSRFGSRGLGFEAGEHYVRGEPDALADALAAVQAEAEAETRRRVDLAYDRVSTTFDWPVIARGWLARDAVRELVALS